MRIIRKSCTVNQQAEDLRFTLLPAGYHTNYRRIAIFSL
jgi:hypothetical protein